MDEIINKYANKPVKSIGHAGIPLLPGVRTWQSTAANKDPATQISVDQVPADQAPAATASSSDMQSQEVRELLDTIRNQQQDLRTQLQAVRNEQESVAEDVGQNVASLETALDTNQVWQQELISELDATRSEHDNLQQGLGEVEQHVARMQVVGARYDQLQQAILSSGAQLESSFELTESLDRSQQQLAQTARERDELRDQLRLMEESRALDRKRLETTQKQLGNVVAEREQLKDRTNDWASRFGALEKSTLEDSEQLSHGLKAAQQELTIVTEVRDRLQNQTLGLQKDADQAQHQLHDANRQLSATREEIARLKTANEHLRCDKTDRDDRLQTAHRQLQNLVAERDTISSNKQELERELETVRADLIAEQSRATGQQDEITRLQLMIQEQLDEIQVSSTASQRLDEELSQRLDVESRRAEQAIRERDELYRQANENHLNADHLAQAHGELESRLLQAEAQRDQLEEGAANLNRLQATLENENGRLTQQLDETRETLKSTMSELEDIQGQRDGQEEEKHQASQTIAELQEQLKAEQQRLQSRRIESEQLQLMTVELRRQTESLGDRGRRERQQSAEQLEVIMGELEVVQSDRRQLQERAQILAHDVQDLREQLDRHDTTLSETEDLRDRFEDETTSLSRELSAAKQRLSERDAAVEKEMETERRLRQEIARSLQTAMEELERTINDRNILHTRLEDLKTKYDSAMANHSESEERMRSTMNDMLKETRQLCDAAQREQRETSQELDTLRKDYRQLQIRLRLQHQDSDNGTAAQRVRSVDGSEQAKVSHVFTKLHTLSQDDARSA